MHNNEIDERHTPGIVASYDLGVPAEWDRLMEFRRGGFWNFSPQDYPQPFADGPVYVIEAAMWGDRTRVVQHVPSPGPFRELCREMFLLSGMKTATSEGSLLLY